MSVGHLYRSICLCCRSTPVLRRFASSLDTSPSSSTHSSSMKIKLPKAEKVLPPSVLDNSKLQDYLDKIAATKDTVTLADIERRRPKQAVPIINSSNVDKYAEQYGKLLDSLVYSFSQRQLRTFVKLYGLQLPKPKTKWTYATTIIENQWGWPALPEIQKRTRDWSEVSNETFPLDVQQLFLLLGPDGSDLLALSLKYKVHVTVSSNPLSIKVEGVRGALEQFREHITSLKADIAEEILVLPTNQVIRSDLFQQISRLSAALTLDSGKGKIQIIYKKSEPRSLFIAKRLAMRASCEISESQEHQRPRVLAHTPPGVPMSTQVPNTLFPHLYSLYPFSPSRPLPWISNARSAFRVRKVGEWITANTSEDLNRTGGLVMGLGRVSTLDDRDCSLRDILGEIAVFPSQSREITASPGHVLITTPQTTIIPPFTGMSTLGNILQWMQSSATNTIFTPVIPLPFLKAHSGSHLLLHRLIYQTLPSPHDPKSFPRLLKFELLLSAPVQKSDYEAYFSLPLTHRCLLGEERLIHTMMPNRPLDLQFTIFDSAELPPAAWPKNLSSYVFNLQSFLKYTDVDATQPDAPLALTVNDEYFALRSSSSVRQTIMDMEPSVDDTQPLRAMTESVLDLEGNQKYSTTKITCGNITDDSQWKTFLRGCDAVTATNTSHEGPLYPADSLVL